MTLAYAAPIAALNDSEIDAVFGGTVIGPRVLSRAFGWVGIVHTILWAGEVAHDAGVWVGSH